MFAVQVSPTKTLVTYHFTVLGTSISSIFNGEYFPLCFFAENFAMTTKATCSGTGGKRRQQGLTICFFICPQVER